MARRIAASGMDDRAGNRYLRAMSRRPAKPRARRPAPKPGPPPVPPAAEPFDVEAFSRRVQETEAKLRPLVPDIHPFDLHTIVHSLLMPLERRVFFLKRLPNGGYRF